MVSMRPLREYMILFGAIIELSVPSLPPSTQNRIILMDIQTLSYSIQQTSCNTILYFAALVI